MSKHDIFEQVRQKLTSRTPMDQFTVTCIQALQHIQTSGHANRVEAVQCLRACVNCHDRQDYHAARVLLHVAAALLDQELCRATWMVIDTAMRPPKDVEHHSHD